MPAAAAAALPPFGSFVAELMLVQAALAAMATRHAAVAGAEPLQRQRQLIAAGRKLTGGRRGLVDARRQVDALAEQRVTMVEQRSGINFAREIGPPPFLPTKAGPLVIDQRSLVAGEGEIKFDQFIHVTNPLGFHPHFQASGKGEKGVIQIRRIAQNLLLADGVDLAHLRRGKVPAQQVNDMTEQKVGR